jgi:DNA-binding HxlR family transcriptional regulator
VLERIYEGQVCSVARTLEVVGERWSLLILRDTFLGLSRFDEFQRSLGIATNVLAARLERLTQAGIMDKRPYQERPERFEYTLTAKGRNLYPVIAALMEWGDRYVSPVPPRLVTHRADGGRVRVRVMCEECRSELERGEIEVRRNPALEHAQ